MENSTHEIREGYVYCEPCAKYLQAKPAQTYKRHLLTKGHLKKTGQEIQEEEEEDGWCQIF
jgi:hypothetical protein